MVGQSLIQIPLQNFNIPPSQKAVGQSDVVDTHWLILGHNGDSTFRKGAEDCIPAFRGKIVVVAKAAIIIPKDANVIPLRRKPLDVAKLGRQVWLK